MTIMSEEYLIRNCAPTLAGIKTGSLFTCPYSSKAEVISSLRGLNQKLLSKGLRVLPLRFSENRALIYLYRPKRLEWDLHQAESVRILQSLGYGCAGSEQCLVHLSRKLRAQEDFPHEIGLFLGYPPGDVCGFMEGRACKCIGCWKVYTDEAGAKHKFDQYRKCTRIYRAAWAKGTDIERLAVAD